MFVLNIRKIDTSTFSVFPREKLAKLHDSNLLSLYDTRSLKYIALSNSCLAFMKAVPLQAGIIYNSKYIDDMFKQWLALASTQYYLATLGDFNISTLMYIWVATDIVIMSEAGYIFNELEFLEEKPKLVEYIRNMIYR